MFTQEWLWELLRQVAIAVLTALLGALGYHAAVARPRFRRLERALRQTQLDIGRQDTREE